MVGKSPDMHTRSAPVDFTKTPEFVAAVRDAVAAATQEIMVRLETARAETPSTT